MDTLPKSVSNISEAGDDNVAAEVEVIVGFDPFDNNKLLLEPNERPAFLGQAIIWTFEGLLPDHRIEFEFPGFADPMTGPFSSLTISDSTARGEDFGFASPMSGPLSLGVLVHYNLEVSNESGRARGHDPLIASLGDPPTPVEEA